MATETKPMSVTALRRLMAQPSPAVDAAQRRRKSIRLGFVQGYGVNSFPKANR